MNIDLVLDYKFVLALGIVLLLNFRPNPIIEITKLVTHAHVKVVVKGLVRS